MPPEAIDASAFSADVLELFRLLTRHEVRYLVVGGEAVIFYGHTRLTGDIDIFVERTSENARGLFSALQEFWHGSIPELTDGGALEAKGVILWFGMPPNWIDLLNEIDGVAFGDAWRRRVPVSLEGRQPPLTLSYIGLEDLIVNKRASGRAKGREDLVFLERALWQGR